MEALIDAVVDFIKVRQLNFAVAALLTAGYLVYQYWGLMAKEKTDELECPHSMHRLGRPRSRSRSRSRTRSGNYYDKNESKYRRRAYGRCPDCSKCNLENAM